MNTIIAVKTIEATGQQINIIKVLQGQGTHDGEVCNLCVYVENGVKRLIEAPLLAK